MKKYFLFFGAAALLAVLLMSSDYYYGSYTPVFMDRSELEKSVSYVAEGRDLQNPGKIYYKSPYILVNEKYKGVHIIDNSDPKNPRNTGYIIAPGCLDMAVKGDVLYLDNSVDLVAFDLNTRQVTERIKNIFPEPISPEKIYYMNGKRPTQNSVIVGWKKRD
ncbi:MAG: hypothetical protein LBR64_03845 [Dysgonamonadaceae bacterium]|jgi:hypothetical protein|nr:hypothetical protein [Dysgonamonadaceae bacterium]